MLSRSGSIIFQPGALFLPNGLTLYFFKKRMSAMSASICIAWSRLYLTVALAAQSFHQGRFRFLPQLSRMSGEFKCKPVDLSAVLDLSPIRTASEISKDRSSR